MRCVLVIPSWLPEDIFPARTAGSQLNYWQPVGTLYVASSLKKAGHEVRFVNGAFLAHRELLDEIARFKPGFVGIYATAFGWPGAKKTAADVKERLPGAFVCAGGPYPIAERERCLADAPALDAVVTGEGERAAVEI